MTKTLALPVCNNFLCGQFIAQVSIGLRVLGACAGSMRGMCTTQWPSRMLCCG